MCIPPKIPPPLHAWPMHAESPETDVKWRVWVVPLTSDGLIPGGLKVFGDSCASLWLKRPHP
jgi:hypothetical protein